MVNPSGDHSDAKLGPGRGIDQLRGLVREAIRPDGLRRILGCLARCVAGHAVLLEADGRLSYSSSEMGHDLLEAVDEEVERVRTGRAHSTTAERDTKVIVVMAISNRTSGPVLVVVGGRPEVARHKELIADTARLLWLCWQVEMSNRTMQRLKKADTQVREVVLHLLMLGQHGGARRVAATMGPRLADPIRVYLAECERRPGARDALVAQCTDACGARAWVVRCPVYPRHVIVLAPVERATDQAPEAFDDRRIRTDRFEEGFRAFVLDHRDVHVGASQVVSLCETAAGYEQAFHALAAAKAGKKGYARFSSYDELATLLGEPGRAWSREVLAPLLNHVPARPQDPDAETLKVTLDSWLSFHHGAVRLLKIHRNTLSARLRRIECLLDCDLRQVRTQATLHLALRIQHCPRLPERGDREDSIEGMLDTDAVRRWAQRRLAPLLTDDAEPLLTTLQTWLANNARLDAAAAVLGTRYRASASACFAWEEFSNGPCWTGRPYDTICGSLYAYTMARASEPASRGWRAVISLASNKPHWAHRYRITLLAVQSKTWPTVDALLASALSVTTALHKGDPSATRDRQVHHHGQLSVVYSADIGGTGRAGTLACRSRQIQQQLREVGWLR